MKRKTSKKNFLPAKNKKYVTLTGSKLRLTPRPLFRHMFPILRLQFQRQKSTQQQTNCQNISLTAEEILIIKLKIQGIYRNNWLLNKTSKAEIHS